MFSYCWNLEIAVIPTTVREIENDPFSQCLNLKGVVLHKDLTAICPNDGRFFTEAYDEDTYELLPIPNVYFYGTAQEWEALKEKGVFTTETFMVNDLSAAIYFYSEEEPTDTEGLYWHYNENGMPAIWQA